MQEQRRFKDCLIERQTPKGIDILCGLKHFAIITYAVPAERFDGLFPDRFVLDTIQVGEEKLGLVSVVPFIDVDFTSAVFPFPKFTMGQTNYRNLYHRQRNGRKGVYGFWALHWIHGR